MIERPLYFLVLLIFFLILCILSTILRILRFHRQTTIEFQQLSLANRNALPQETTRERIAEHLTRQWRERRRSSSLSSISSAVFASIRSIGATAGDDDDDSKDNREEKIQKAILRMTREAGDQMVETKHKIIRRRSSLSFNFPRSSFSESKQIEECAICLDSIHVGETIATSSMHKCLHAFHEGCIQIWLREHDECPMCRRKWIVS